MRTASMLALLLSALPAIAQSTQSTSAPSSQPATTQPIAAATPIQPKVEKGGPPDRGFQLQARLISGISLGYRKNRRVYAAELGITSFFSQQPDGFFEQIFSSIFLPYTSYDRWISPDGRARLSTFGGIGVSTLSAPFFDPSFLGPSINTKFGLAGDYYMHKNFAFGGELSLRTGREFGDPFLTMSGALRVTFVTGK